MSTIAIKDGIIAADTCNYPYNNHNGIGLRIAKIKYGLNSETLEYDIIACVGNYHQCKMFIEWFALEQENDIFLNYFQNEKLNFNAIVYSSVNDSYSMYSNSCNPIEIGDMSAIGSGESYALGAMGFGASAIESIFVASNFDPFTNNKIQFINVKNQDCTIELLSVN